MLLHDHQSPPIQTGDGVLIGIPAPGAHHCLILPGVRLGANHSISPGSTIFGNVYIGRNFTCGPGVLIREQVAIGDNVTIGKNVSIGRNACIESRVTIAGNTQIPDGSVISEGTFIGENVRFLGADGGGARAGPVRLKDNCIIGGDCIISHGIIIGEYARVAAGTRVSRNVPANIFTLGDPLEFRSRID